MLKKENRVGKKLFPEIVKKGFSCYSQNISLKSAKTPDFQTKFSVYTPKKEIKSAVKRNLLKRRTLSVLRELLPKTNSNTKAVFLLKKGAIDLPYPKLQEEVFFLLKKAKII